MTGYPYGLSLFFHILLKLRKLSRRHAAELAHYLVEKGAHRSGPQAINEFRRRGGFPGEVGGFLPGDQVVDGIER